jgi:ketosteroid isomerase-like protein
MTNREAIEAVIVQSYAARENGDIEKLMSAFHPDAVFELAGSKTALVVAGAVQGHQDIRTTMAGFIKNFDFVHREIISMAIDGDCAAVHSRVEIRYNPGNKIFTTDILDSFLFEDGKISKLVEFADTALIKDLIFAD